MVQYISAITERECLYQLFPAFELGYARFAETEELRYEIAFFVEQLDRGHDTVFRRFLNNPCAIYKILAHMHIEIGIENVEPVLGAGVTALENTHGTHFALVLVCRLPRLPAKIMMGSLVAEAWSTMNLGAFCASTG